MPASASINRGEFVPAWQRAKDRLVKAFKLFVAERHYLLVRYERAHRRSWMDAVSRVKKERDLLLNHAEACQLLAALTATAKVPGDIAEVGVAFGASAKLIAQYAGGRVLHLFDTFEGLPETSAKDGERFQAGQFQGTLEDVQRYVGHNHVRYYKGLFPQTAGPVERTVFSFVHIDVDLYTSTLSCLEFFYPRLAPGGILISHDYLTAGGVDAAFQEFFADKPEPVIELSGYQCMMVKTGGPHGQAPAV